MSETPQHPVSRAELEALRQMQSETHNMLSDLYQKLVEPSPGQSKGLLDRMAAVTISIESGERVSGMIVKVAMGLAAVGALYAAVKAGIFPGALK